jgi:predicted NAD/FAD-dependent oxidoreductase
MMMVCNKRETDVLIVGAGMSGLMAAKDLAQAGRRVLVVDKGRGIGGRMAYRRMGEAVVDHGAQYVSARNKRFCEVMASLAGQGVVAPWSEGMPGLPGDHTRWRGAPNMKAIPAALAWGLEVECDTKINSIHRDGQRWRVMREGAGEIDCAAMIVTAPIPQALALLDTGGVAVEESMRVRLEQVEYFRCFTVMAVLDEPSGLPAPGVMTFSSGSLAWLADNQLKGISPVPALTLQASPDFSLARWEMDREETAKLLLAEAAPYFAGQVVEHQIHGWRYSKPVNLYGEPFARVGDGLWLAGDAFGGARVEGAALSGWAAAADLLAEGQEL